MKKIPADDRRARYRASDESIDRDGLRDHLAGKHQWVLATTRTDGRPQMSLVTGGLTADGRLAIASYPSRAKVKNARRNPDVSVLVMGDGFQGAWLQVDGRATVLDMPDPAAADALVAYFRCISGEHDDWDDYRQAMEDQGKSAIMIEPTRWSPVSKGGFPPELFED
ncbi:MAG: PPOX class F420-dependent oxidoreductase [Acidimicrobiales bacterium]|nr:PPOX class F420-dependent oxidoreductase [Acidimicrobiales bacterium]